MAIDPARIAAEAFFLYAETFLPDAEARDATLAALRLCAEGTGRATPSVATYLFRPSPLAALVGDRLHPGSLALESTELYLTHAGFRDHLTTDAFRTGLRAMYKGPRRLGARIFWIGARPASDMLHNIFRSDPEARPVMPVRDALFDADLYRASRTDDVAVLSLGRIVARGEGAGVLDAVDAIAGELRAISLVAFFHPLAPELLRLFAVLPLDEGQRPERVSALIRPLAAGGPDAPLTGHAQVHRDRPDLAVALGAALADAGAWTVAADGYEGYVSHPAVATDASPGRQGEGGS